MIWVGGRLVADDALRVSVLDRTFEHGLGLFETLRTWNRRAPLLDRHLARMTRSAEALAIPLDRAQLPDAKAVAELVEDSVLEGDAMLRITLTGGRADSDESVLWMRTMRLPPQEMSGYRLDTESWWRVLRDDPLAKHKSLNYWGRRLVHEHARERGFDEVLSRSDDGCFWEGSRTNLFLVVDDRLVTPSLDGPIVPGVMRELVIECAKRLRLEIVQSRAVTLTNLRSATEVFLTNSVRGLIPVPTSGSLAWDPSAPVCRSLQVLVTEWLNAGERP